MTKAHSWRRMEDRGKEHLVVAVRHGALRTVAVVEPVEVTFAACRLGWKALASTGCCDVAEDGDVRAYGEAARG